MPAEHADAFSSRSFAPSTSPAPLDSGFETQTLEQLLGAPLEPSRWIGWRLRLLVLAVLLGCVGIFLLIRTLAAWPHVDAVWRASDRGQIELVSSSEPGLTTLRGRTLLGVGGGDMPMVTLDALALQRSARWLVNDSERDRHRALQEQLARVMAQRDVKLYFTDGVTTEVRAQPRGLASLGALFWLLAALALVLYLVSMVVLLARPSMRSAVYAGMSLCQAGNLLFIAVESVVDLGLPRGFNDWDLQARMAFDLVTAAAIVHATTVHPRPLDGASWLAALAWGLAFALIALHSIHELPAAWWWTQAVTAAMGVMVIVQLTWSNRREPHPFAVVLRRFGVIAVGTWILLTVAIASADQLPALRHNIAAIGSVIWYVFIASLLLLMPFLSRSQQVMREFSMLAAISTVATSLDLLFAALFSLSQFASLTLSLFLSLGLYAGARQWILNQMMGSSMLTTERMFEQLYRIAREVELHPERTAELLSQLLRELFEPLEMSWVDRHASHSRVVADGSTLLVPVPELAPRDDELQAPGSLLLRFAQRGRRMFTHDDTRLADRVVEQLKRAVAFDQAVEQGRSEERARLAQDLHDDIGARLLTLMYKAQSPEMEDYLRHTLQDLKTLTRGLAAPSHRLSHAAAEWKTDITQRLTAAHCDLAWSFSFDRDMMLSVVQWSALTRVLRELVSNAIAHAQASQVDIDFTLQDERLVLTISDNGVGRNPHTWSHGLGLGGVRKRVKQLGGEVEWAENAPIGIVCRVRIDELSDRH
ncbi:MAG TPA: ATP-binding protein [Burkholderiaceae bacterium]|jgi:signal transduction histidine kinase|nr:ATP-binding protein [Burkholderiaceae bacterium]